MRRMMLALCMLAMLTGSAQATTAADYWTGREDIYYHADSACGSPAYGRVAVSREAAEMFDRKPCPVCVTAAEPAAADEPQPQADPADAVTVAERSGTWVFRLPKAALEGLSFEAGALPEGAEMLVEIYGGTLTDVLDARVMLPADGSTLLSLRVIDGDAFAVVRPAKRYKEKRPFRWVAAHLISDIFNPGAFSLSGVSQVFDYVPEHVVHRSGQRKRFSEKYGDLQIDVYRALEANIAVIHLRGAMASDRLTGAVAIGDAGAGIPVTGYVDEKKSVFCLMLTDGELEALEAGAKPAYTPRAELTPAAVPDLSDDDMELG